MLPEKFKERMKELLKEDYQAFETALGEKNVRAIRVNETKISTENFLRATKLDLSPISYATDGFIPDNVEGIGRSPEHHAGMFYVQDPGAMATVKAVEIQKGWRVLDSCAAPGGKASQLASAIGDEGVLLANEYVPKRAKIIVSNFERLGIKNALITSLDTAKLSKMFDSYFDLVLCDAPCSGEGMFRCTMAMTAETRINSAIITRITFILPFSVIFPLEAGTMRSKVMVEPLVSTKEDKVDMEAESTSTKTTAIKRSGIPLSIAGIITSKPSAATVSGEINSRPKPPMK